MSSPTVKGYFSDLINEKFDYNSHWITEQCNRGLPGISAGPFLTGVIKFALIWDLIWLVWVVTRRGHYTVWFLFAWGLALLWVNVAPFLIWLYDQIVLPQFFEKFEEINPDRQKLEDLSKRYNDFIADPPLLLALFWAVGMLIVAWAGTPVLKEQGMSGVGRPFLWLSYLYAIYMGGVLGEAGTAGVTATLLMIREISDLDFDIQPLHPDQLGGLSNVGYYAIRTTLLYSSGSLFIPLGFSLLAGSSGTYLILTTIAVYIVSVLLVFAYPTVKINRKASQMRDEILDELREKMHEMQAEIETSEGGEIEAVSKQLKLERTRSKYEDYKNVRLYPLQIDILIKLVASILLPIIMIFLEIYIKDMLIY